MSKDSHFFDWCKMPPEPPKNRHKRLVAGSLIITILGVSLISGLAMFNVSMMAGQTGALAMPQVVLSVVNVAEGPKYLQNVTYQCTNDTYQQTNQNNISPIRFSCKSSSSNGEIGNSIADIINNGETDLTVTSIEIYRGYTLFAVIDGPLNVKAHSKGEIAFQVQNLQELAKGEVQWLTGKQNLGGETSREWVQYWRPVLYNAVIKTSEGVTFTDYSFIFPVATGPVNA